MYEIFVTHFYTIFICEVQSGITLGKALHLNFENIFLIIKINKTNYKLKTLIIISKYFNVEKSIIFH